MLTPPFLDNPLHFHQCEGCVRIGLPVLIVSSSACKDKHISRRVNGDNLYFDETESKSVHTKKNVGTNRNKRSKTLNEIKPVEKHE